MGGTPGGEDRDAPVGGAEVAETDRRVRDNRGPDNVQSDTIRLQLTVRELLL
ncbi:hypothetical protein ACFRAU_01900 [Arthrobacter sp. NPDC056691]|uniref:hypothetical protein n=1 Tax=Arthrobacter sp. NPDC056691 TaxID=3345913 RepID=UPI00366FA33A